MKSNNGDRYISIPEVKKMLLIDSEREGFTQEKREILHHAELFSFLPSEETLKLIEELQKIDRINSYHAHKLAEILPKGDEELRAIFAKEIMSPSEEEMKKIMETIMKFI
ncbi:MAG: DNA-directed RNA polymerase subunit F [Candidatus Thermoplasmatota archaeon]|jgi:DNA-directed RNA polymerase subunit F|nr:DNA-directed RNA polymerase subunit F [Candidatus Thermoplasmatota archaeon]